MTTIINMLRHKLVVRCAGLAALCVLIWFVGPKIAFGKKVPLGPEFNRLLAIMVVLVLWALYHFIQQSRSRKKEQQLMTDLAADPKDASQATVEEAQSKEVAELRRKFEHALQSLKTARSKGWRGSQYLYELPWYVIIGAPGCGKTTLLANSGLRFPLSGKVDRDDIQGVGGTRNCDWLFTDDAIFLDTAGRYTTQDSHQAVDAGAWHGFLGLIKKTSAPSADQRCAGGNEPVGYAASNRRAMPAASPPYPPKGIGVVRQTRHSISRLYDFY